MEQNPKRDPNEILNNHYWYLIRRRAQETQIRSAFQIFRKAGVEPILIKGWAASKYYPEPERRISGDIDLAVGSDDFTKARELINLDEIKILNIDLHKELKWLDTVSWQNLFDNSVLTDIDGIGIRTLRPEDHLRLLCVHWLNDGGAYKNKLWDIYYAVENRPYDFDWSRCLDLVSETRKGWIICAIGIANKYLGLKIDDLPFAERAKNIPLWVLQCVEREWKSNIRLSEPERLFRQPVSLLKQIRKRIPPNPIQASVEMEQPIDKSSRLPIQISNTIRKIVPSSKRVLRSIIRSKESKV